MEWQPIETAPKDGTTVLLWWPARAVGGKNGAYAGAWADARAARRSRPGWFSYEITGFWVRREVRTRDGQPTHWMPLTRPAGAEEVSGE